MKTLHKEKNQNLYVYSYNLSAKRTKYVVLIYFHLGHNEIRFTSRGRKQGNYVLLFSKTNLNKSDPSIALQLAASS